MFYFPFTEMQNLVCHSEEAIRHNVKFVILTELLQKIQVSWGCLTLKVKANCSF